eukprot:gene198-biopygen2165
MAEYVDYYEVLGIEVTASNDDIRKAYKEQAMRWHPDKASAKNKEAATERFKVVSGSYEELSDAGRREKYDQRRATTSDCRQGRSVALDEAWEIFIKFIISACVKQFELDAGRATRVVRLISTLGVATVLTLSCGGGGGVALSALTAALLNQECLMSVYRNLNEAEKVAFSQAIMLLAQHVMEQ